MIENLTALFSSSGTETFAPVRGKGRRAWSFGQRYLYRQPQRRSGAFAGDGCFRFTLRVGGLPVTLIEAQAAGLPCYVSSNVSADADVSPLVEHLPIDDASLWAEKLLNAPPRRDVTEYIVRAGFDARTSAEKMTELYLRLAGEK